MKLGRHKGIDVRCDWCGDTFVALAKRVEQGLGRFCSKEHFHLWRQQYQKDNVWGRKDLATRYKSGNRYCARWYDENGKTKSCTYPRWWWEMNIGDIPFGMIVLYKDNNPMNLDPSNFILGTNSDALKVGNTTRKGNPTTWKTYIDKLRTLKTGSHPSEETKKKMSISGKLRTTGRYAGNQHYRWRGGVPKDYPKEFYEIRDFIISRDNSQCQICSRNLLRGQHVHHRDGVREHNDQNNLITFCASCHGKVHANNPVASPHSPCI